MYLPKCLQKKNTSDYDENRKTTRYNFDKRKIKFHLLSEGSKPNSMDLLFLNSWGIFQNT